MQRSLRKFSALCTVIFAVVLWAALLTTLTAQDGSAFPRLGVPVFQHLTGNSGYIFAGTVTAVSRVEPKSQNDIETVQITFHVEQAFRGVRKGQTLVVREWVGLWNSGEHYRVGERVTLFLFRPGKLGLTSPVGREFGRFQVDPRGHVLLNKQHIAAVSSDPVLASWRGRSRISWEEFSRDILRESQEN